MNRGLVARIDHLRRLTDPRGLLHAAAGDCPDRSEGYRTIENADALRLCALASEGAEADTCRTLARVYFSFLTKARMEDGRARHACDAHGGWHNDDDEMLVQARLARALASVIVSELPIPMRLSAASWWRALLPHARDVRTPLAAGTWLAAIGQLRTADPGRDPGIARSLADWLVEDCYYAVRSSDWEWFETRWSREAATCVTGLWYAAEILGEDRYRVVAGAMTRFVMTHLFRAGMLVPVGTRGGWARHNTRATFDQEPQEACTIVELLSVAARVSGESLYADYAAVAAEWFTGNNVRAESLVCRETGGCYRAIRSGGLDPGQPGGAVLAWLLSQAALMGAAPDHEPLSEYAGGMLA